jgi:UDP-N-acetylmuramoyl-tripeptide--D-alanyl-D-alanine ligase
MKKILKFKLKVIAKLILRKYKPEIIGITGSVGKTSAKEAIFAVLSSKYRVGRNIKNYNNEIGLPLTIIGDVSAQGKNIFGWLKVFWVGFRLIIFRDKNYPEILILEMGVDRPDDMKYLTGIATCDIGVVTAIGPAHLEFFNDVKDIQKEKGILVKTLNKGGRAILNYDDELAMGFKDQSRAKILTYGFKEGAEVRAQELRFSFEDKAEAENLLGISFKLRFNGSVVPVFLPDVIGYAAIYAALAGAAVGLAKEMNLLEISQALRSYRSPRGRMNLIDGIKKTVIIDDTYNGALPQGSLVALDIIKMIKLKSGSKKIAVIGDMRELGPYSEEAHRNVGKKVSETGINVLITVGELAKDIARGAEEAGMSKDFIFSFSKPEEAGLFLQDRMETGDLIFVKGSQGIRCEKIVKEVMADPLRASELLVRQDREWENR